MEKEEAIAKLKEMTNAEVWLHETANMSDYCESDEELEEWCMGHDEDIIIVKDGFDVNKCTLEFYGCDSEDRDITCWILSSGDSVVAYGYSGD